LIEFAVFAVGRERSLIGWAPLRRAANIDSNRVADQII
jgi:hypothetical protein